MYDKTQNMKRGLRKMPRLMAYRPEMQEEREAGRAQRCLLESVSRTWKAWAINSRAMWSQCTVGNGGKVCSFWIVALNPIWKYGSTNWRFAGESKDDLYYRSTENGQMQHVWVTERNINRMISWAIDHYRWKRKRQRPHFGVWEVGYSAN